MSTYIRKRCQCCYKRWNISFELLNTSVEVTNLGHKFSQMFDVRLHLSLFLQTKARPFQNGEAAETIERAGSISLFQPFIFIYIFSVFRSIFRLVVTLTWFLLMSRIIMIFISFHLFVSTFKIYYTIIEENVCDKWRRSEKAEALTKPVEQHQRVTKNHGQNNLLLKRHSSV